jgi:hypothetical protein
MKNGAFPEVASCDKVYREPIPGAALALQLALFGRIAVFSFVGGLSLNPLYISLSVIVLYHTLVIQVKFQGEYARVLTLSGIRIIITL